MKLIKRFYVDRNAPDKENPINDKEEITVEEEAPVESNGDIKKYLRPERLKIQHLIALLLVTTFCTITVLFAVAAVIKGDANMFETIWSVLGPLIGAIVGYYFGKSRT